LNRVFISLLKSQTAKIIAAEKDGFWSDWTPFQQEMYASGDWETFSRSRGYTEEEIRDFRDWISLMIEGFGGGLIALKLLVHRR